MTSLNLNSDIIDVRDIIERLEELDSIFVSSVGPKAIPELKQLIDLMDELKSVGGGDEQWRGDWYPLTLIKDSCFTDYIKELIDDCYELPKELTSGNWPYRHIKIDYEAAAKEATVDYTSIEINGETYWTR